jgi:hypothetical protein
MGSLRATGLALGTDVKTAGLEAPVMRFSATLVDGGRATLEVGTRFKDERGQDLHYVRKAGDSIVYTLGADGVQTLRKAFVRTQAP